MVMVFGLGVCGEGVRVRRVWEGLWVRRVMRVLGLG